jgi:hypothetical protein
MYLSNRAQTRDERLGKPRRSAANSDPPPSTTLLHSFTTTRSGERAILITHQSAPDRLIVSVYRRCIVSCCCKTSGEGIQSSLFLLVYGRGCATVTPSFRLRLFEYQRSDPRSKLIWPARRTSPSQSWHVVIHPSILQTVLPSILPWLGQ